MHHQYTTRTLEWSLLNLLVAVTSQPPAPSSCIDFSVYPGQQAVNCLPFANCSGAKCNMTNLSGYASFIVHKCQDPVTVDLSVVTGDSVFHRRFNQTETVSSDQWPHMQTWVSATLLWLHCACAYVCLVSCLLVRPLTINFKWNISQRWNSQLQHVGMSEGECTMYCVQHQKGHKLKEYCESSSMHPQYRFVCRPLIGW